MDDESSFLDLAKKFMHLVGSEDFDIHPLTDPLKVFAELEGKNIDVIVTDYQMPSMK